MNTLKSILRNRNLIIILAFIITVGSYSAFASSPSPKHVIAHKATSTLSQTHCKALGRTIGTGKSVGCVKPTQTVTPLFVYAYSCLVKPTNNKSAAICVKTLPDTQLYITVEYPDGRIAQDDALGGGAVSDYQGNFIYQWIARSHTKGMATYEVTARLGGQFQVFDGFFYLN